MGTLEGVVVAATWLCFAAREIELPPATSTAAAAEKGGSKHGGRSWQELLGQGAVPEIIPMRQGRPTAVSVMERDLPV